MERRHFIRMSGALAAFTAAEAVAGTKAVGKAASRNIYEWRIYTLKEGGSPLLDAFHSDTLIPALKRQKVKTGYFKPLKAEEAELLRYSLFVYADWDAFHKVKSALWQDAAFTKSAQPYFDATAPKPAYSEIQTFLCEAFSGIPTFKQPAAERTILEFRNYKSPNEEANRRKIKMFESGETAIFDKAGIHSVCYGNVIAGPRMPSLVYLTWHKDEATRNEAWKNFSASPEWQSLRVMPEYANTATDNKVVLLSPLPYSEI